MKFRIEIWTVGELKDRYNNGKINLNPPYQRKFIWSLKDQQILINSMLKGYAIPNIFLYENVNDSYEMVDGQQRTRTILGFLDNQFSTIEGHSFNALRIQKNFLSYPIPVTIIEKIDSGETIEEFYSLVNKSGIHLNRPELKKAEFFDTKFLKLITELSGSSNFQSLDLFSDNTSKRMSDVDFVSELVTYLKEGVSDKKIKVDKVFENDISQIEYDTLKNRFLLNIEVICSLNQIHPIRKTRYKQRNDFYTLFCFVDKNISLNSSTLSYFYNLLVRFNDDISPSNEKCEPFQLYAFHCISQSNSKNARDERLNILNSIFLNRSKTPNKIQKSILKFYGLNNQDIDSVEEFITISLSKLN